MVGRNVEAKEEIQDIEDNLQPLTVGVPDISIDDFLGATNAILQEYLDSLRCYFVECIVL